MRVTWTISGNLSDYAKWQEEQAAHIAALEAAGQKVEADCAVLRKAFEEIKRDCAHLAKEYNKPYENLNGYVCPDAENWQDTVDIAEKALTSTTAGAELLEKLTRAEQQATAYLKVIEEYGKLYPTVSKKAELADRLYRAVCDYTIGVSNEMDVIAVLRKYDTLNAPKGMDDESRRNQVGN